MLEGEADINSSLQVLLSTTVGERIMQPHYGCFLKQFIFEPVNEAMQFPTRRKLRALEAKMSAYENISINALLLKR